MKYLLLSLLFCGLFAEARLHVEPYIGYGVLWSRPIDFQAIKNEIQGIQAETDQAGRAIKGIDSIQKSLEFIQTTTVYRGSTGGVRLGYSNLGLALGLDLTYGSFGRLSGSGDLSNLSFLLPGLFVSYKIPLLFRAYGSIIPRVSQLSFIKLSNYDGTEIGCSGAGFKGGASYLSLPFVSINIEYQGLYGANSTPQCKNTYHALSAFINFIF